MGSLAMRTCLVVIACLLTPSLGAVQGLRTESTGGTTWMGLSKPSKHVKVGAEQTGRIAEMLVREGAQVSILDLPQSKGAEVAKQLDGSFHACDVTDFEGTEAALLAACDELGALHFVCNTAGGGIGMRTLTKKGPHPLDEFRRKQADKEGR